MKKLIAVFCSVLFIFAAVLPVSAAARTPAEQAHLHFNADGKFRILNFADFQDDITFSSLTEKFVRNSVAKYHPDVIVLNGDNIAGYLCATKSASEKSIRNVMEVLQDVGVPVALVFGNHDDEGRSLSKTEQMKIYREYSVCIAFDEADYGQDLSGVGTYCVPVYESASSDKVKFALWMFDSGSDDSVEDKDNYDHVHADQVAWYKSESQRLNAASGETVYGIAFQHIIVNEIYEAFEPASKNEKGAVPYLGKWYKLPATASADSSLGEAPCPSYGNEGEFAAFRDGGNVLALVCGHDHANSYVIPYQGVDLICTAGCGFGSYGDTAIRGARVIDLNKNDTSRYETFTYLYTDVEDDSTLTHVWYLFMAFWKQLYLLFNNAWVLLREAL